MSKEEKKGKKFSFKVTIGGLEIKKKGNLSDLAKLPQVKELANAVSGGVESAKNILNTGASVLGQKIKEFGQSIETAGHTENQTKKEEK